MTDKQTELNTHVEKFVFVPTEHRLPTPTLARPCWPCLPGWPGDVHRRPAGPAADCKTHCTEQHTVQTLLVLSLSLSTFSNTEHFTCPSRCVPTVEGDVCVSTYAGSISLSRCRRLAVSPLLQPDWSSVTRSTGPFNVERPVTIYIRIIKKPRPFPYRETCVIRDLPKAAHRSLLLSLSLSFPPSPSCAFFPRDQSANCLQSRWIFWGEWRLSFTRRLSWATTSCYTRMSSFKISTQAGFNKLQKLITSICWLYRHSSNISRNKNERCSQATFRSRLKSCRLLLASDFLTSAIFSPSHFARSLPLLLLLWQIERKSLFRQTACAIHS